MTGTDQPAEISIRNLARYGFANRWSHYFPLVYGEWLARPQDLVGIRDSIVRQEERLAEEEVRPRLSTAAPDRDRVAAGYRARDSEGLTRALAEGFGLHESIDAFRIDVRNEVQSAISSVDGSDERSYPVYVMALDRAVAFEEAASTILAAHSAAHQQQASPSTYAPPPPEDIDPYPEFDPGPGQEPDFEAERPEDVDEYDDGAARPSRKRSGGRRLATAAAALLLLGGAGVFAAWYTGVEAPEKVSTITASIPLLNLSGPSAELEQSVEKFIGDTATTCTPFVGPLLVVESADFRRCAKSDESAKFKVLDEMLALAGGKWLDTTQRTFEAPNSAESELIQSAIDHDKSRRNNQFRIWRLLREKEKSRGPIVAATVSQNTENAQSAQNDVVHFFGLVSCVCDKAARMKDANADERRKRVFISEMVTQELRKRSHAQLFLQAMPDNLDRFAKKRTPKDVKVLLFSKKSETEAQRQRRAQIQRYRSAGYSVTILPGGN